MSNPITPEWLRKIAEEVEKYPTRWTQCSLARDQAGRPVNPEDPDASCWCVQGFATRDGISNSEGFSPWWGNVARNDSCISPAEFIAWLREMAAEMEVQA